VNEFVWIDLDMAVDFLAGLCFPRAAGEPPRCFRFSGRNLRLALLSTARSNYIHKTYVHDHHEKIRTSL